MPISDADVHAYVDGQLAPERVVRLEAALATDPELAARISEMRAQNAALRDALDAVLAEPIPKQLLAAATTPNPRTSASRRWLAPLFAVARQAAFAHALYAADVNRPVEIWANEEKRLVNWLTKRLGFSVHAPDLNGLGYALVGGRLVAGNEKPTALFMYENADKQRLSLQVRRQTPGTGETAFRYVLENGVGVFYWIDDACGYAISGNVDRAQLLKIAHVVYGQLAAVEAGVPK